MGLLGLGVALVIAVMNLRDARAREKDERRLRKPEADKERRPTGFDGPWGD